MGIKRSLAKIAPKAISDKAIDKGEHNGDDWATVSVVTQAMCNVVPDKDGKMNFTYNDKTVGWAKRDGTSWFDDAAYDEVKKAYDALPEEQRAQYNTQIENLRGLAAANQIPSTPRQVRAGMNRVAAVSDEFSSIKVETDGEEPNYTDD